MHKKMFATAAVASTLGGVVAGATLLAPGQVGAQDGADTPKAVEEHVRPDPGERIAAALQGLVDDGTLTEDQVAAVVQALRDIRPDFDHKSPGGHHGFDHGVDIAGILGLEPEALRKAIVGGQSLSEVAADQGVDPQELIDAIVDAAEERVNGAVESGRIDREKADEILAGTAEKVEDLVNGEIGFPGRRGRGGPRGWFGKGAPMPKADA